MDDLDRFLAEDLGPRGGPGDVTTRAVARGERVRARIVAQEACVVAGGKEAVQVFARLGASAEATVHDGARAAEGQEVVRIDGPAEAVLTGERLALNFLMRMAGIATATRLAVDLAHAVNPRCEVAATRKTTPGFRAWEKRAVALGGGFTHRMGLWDAILVKDNHVAVAGSLRAAVERCRERAPGKPLEVEADTEAQAEEAVGLGAEWVLLDNWGPARLAASVPRLRKLGKARFEASGGIGPQEVTAYAPWVDRVSLGALTHSARAVPHSLELLGVER